MARIIGITSSKKPVVIQETTDDESVNLLELKDKTGTTVFQIDRAGGGSGGGGAPSGPAGGDLTGTYPNPTIAAGVVTDIKTAAANKDGLSGTPSMRTLGTGALQAAAGSDSRLSDARTPTSHATTHKAGGTDSIKLDELAAPTDITTLNSSLSAHGLLQKLSGSTTAFMRGDGAWAVPAGTGGSSIYINVKTDYGAVGDNAANDTTAIQNAVNGLPTAGGTIFFPRGIYKVVGAAGVGIDLTGKESVRFLGEGGVSFNESASTLHGSVLTTPTTGLKLLQSSQTSTLHGGPWFENMTFQASAAAAGSILVYLKNVNHWLFRNCTFRGPTGDLTLIGVQLDGLVDDSYGLTDFCRFYNVFTGYQPITNASIGRVTNCYFLCGAGGSAQANHIHCDLQGSGQTLIGNKFECNDNTGSVAVLVNGNGDSVFANNFEGCPISVSIPNPGSSQNRRTMITGNHFLGSNGTETGISVGGTNVHGVVALGNGFSNLTTEVADGGSDIIYTSRPDGVTVGKYLTLGGPGFYSGGGNPPTVAAPNGSLYLSTSGPNTGTLYVRQNSAWVAK